MPVGSTTSAAFLLSVALLSQAGRDAGLATLAGVYWHSNGFVSHDLVITPEGGFRYEQDGCLGLSDVDGGAAEAVQGHLVLSPVRPNPRRIAFFACTYVEAILDAVASGADLRKLVAEAGKVIKELGSEGLPREYVPVRWGEQRFLVPVGEGKQFCNAFNQGWLARVHTGFYRRDGDERKPVAGLPDVPKDWEPLLLRTPIQGKVVEVLKGGRAKVDFGSEGGAWVGMEVWTDADGFGRAEVVEVGPKTCVIQRQRDDTRFKVGVRVRSRKPSASG
jgi:hypothetical protein